MPYVMVTSHQLQVKILNYGIMPILNSDVHLSPYTLSDLRTSLSEYTDITYFFAYRIQFIRNFKLPLRSRCELPSSELLGNV